MSPAEAAAAMRVLLENNDDDPESTHSDADELLCEVLTNLGYGETVDAFLAMKRWYS